MTSSPVNLVLDRLRSAGCDPKQSGKGFTSRCPAHDDRVPSLSVGTGAKGQALLCCHAGCEQHRVIDALGLQPSDLFQPTSNGNGQHHGRTHKAKSKGGKTLHPTLAAAAKAATWKIHQDHPDWVLVATHDYPNADGAEDAWTLRFESPDGQQKAFQSISRQEGGYVVGKPDHKWPLYQLAKLRGQERFILGEGEKVADALTAIDLPAIASQGGCGNAGATDWTPLAGCEVVISPDRDKAGDGYADEVASILTALDPPAKVRIVRLPDLAEGEDAVEFIADRRSNGKDDPAIKREIEDLAVAAPVYQAQGESSHPTEPPEPPLSLEIIRPRPMPSTIFQGWLGDMIEAAAIATETPRELAVMMALGTLATACQQRFSVRPEPGYFEPLNLWPIVALDSGNRKSKVAMLMLAPLIEHERDLGAEMEPVIKQAESDAKTQQARATALRVKAAKTKDDLEYAQLKEEIAGIESEMPEVPVMPRIFTQDCTPEHLGTMLADHGESMSIISDEGGIFDLMAGRYSSGIPNLDVFLQAHAGSPVRVDRGSRPPVLLNHPTLTICLSPQPEVLRGLTEHRGFRGRGLLARFTYVIPESTLGYRKLESRPIPEQIAFAYGAAIKSLLQVQPDHDENGDKRPHVISLSGMAWKSWKAFARRVEVELRPGGRFEHLTDWAGKLPGAVARIAALFHCAEHAHGRPAEYEINQGIMDRTIELADLLAEHALAAFHMMGADESMHAARKVWAWVVRQQAATFSARDAWHALRGTYKRAEDLHPAFGVLLNTGHISEQEPPREKRVGRPSRIFIVNPLIAESWRAKP